MKRDNVDCEYLLKDGRCKAVAESEDGKAAREKSCTNDVKSACCYLCDNRSSCDVSCAFLDTPEGMLKQNIDVEIGKTQTAVKRLSVLFAEGKMSEESYLTSIAGLENKIARLRDAKTNPKLLDEQGRLPELESGSVETEKPAGLWYLVAFFFGVIGGLIAYVATKDTDQDMATACLVIGILTTMLLGFLGWLYIAMFAL